MGKFTWSGALARKVVESDYLARKAGISSVHSLGFGIALEGPYGGVDQCSFDVFGVRELVLVAGGIGMASVSSLVAKLVKTYHESEHELRAIERVLIIWVCREPESVLWFDALMAQLAGCRLFQ